MVMTENKRAQATIPHQDTRNELSGLVLYTPGNNIHHKIPSGDETYAENRSWKCACN